MPKLMALLPCERVIISGKSEGGDNTATLVALMDTLTVTERVPEDAWAPTRWAIFILWRREEGDTDDIQFEQFCQMVSPSKKVVVSGRTPFKFTKRNQRNTIHVNALPVGEPGDYEVQAWLTKATEPENKIGYATYVVTVLHQLDEPVPVDEPDPAKPEAIE